MRTLLLRLAGPFFTLAGIGHFARPQVYEQIMPPWLPAHRTLVYASGVTEALAGMALMAPDASVRRAGGALGALTMVGVFPANVNMALNAKKFRKVPGGAPALYARLVLQAPLIWWVWEAGRRPSA